MLHTRERRDGGPTKGVLLRLGGSKACATSETSARKSKAKIDFFTPTPCIPWDLGTVKRVMTSPVPTLPTTAFVRALRAVPPRSLDEVRPPAGCEYAFLCSSAKCSRCDDFSRDGRASFEARLPPTTRVLEWECDARGARDAALAAGVEQIPAYVFVPSEGTTRVRPVV